MPGLVLSALLNRVTFMAERPAVRDMRFRTVGISRTLGESSYSLVSVLAAWQGFGGMAVVYGSLARSGVRLVILLATTDWREWARPVRLRLATLRTLASYGTVVAVEGAAAFAARRWDNLLVSRLYGPDVAGHYILAYNLADLPAIQIGEQISDVLLASYAHVAPEKRPAAVLRAATFMTLVMTPLSIGLGAVAPTIARLFSTKWVQIGPMLMVLAAVLVVRPIGGVFSAYLQVRRGPRPSMTGEVIAGALLLTLIFTVGRLGPLWICGMVGLAFTVRALVYMWFVQRADGLRMTTCLGRILPILTASVPLGVAVWGARRALTPLGLPPVVHLGLEIVAGAVGYGFGLLLLARPAALDFLRVVTDTVRRRRLTR